MSKNLPAYVIAFLGVGVLVNKTPGPWKTWDKGTVVDNWTWAHLAWGWIAKKMGVTFEELLALGVINELGEAWIRNNRPEWTYGGPESGLNIAADIAANQVGWKLG